jgi:adenosylcobyric acid synthase
VSEEKKMDFQEKVSSEVRGGVKGPDQDCDYYPCHFPGQDCTFCFCPLYPCEDPELGKFVKGRDGKDVWSCQECYWTHRPDVARALHSLLSHQEGGTDAKIDMTGVKASLERRFNKRAKAIMVLGATSGAGKSFITAALCRVLSDQGFRVAPFKSQNMSLNSCVTSSGEEMARIQELQARAARAEPISAMNPILLKPKGNAVSQVMVEGRPYKDMDVSQYYHDFVKNEAMPIIRRNYSRLARTNDYVVIEGAGSPAEINISGFEVANMRTAEVADADCVLVVNIEWGGAFAYIFGTILLLPEAERRRFKGIIINNMFGDADCLRTGIDRVERELGIPVLGVMPHMEHSLPTEDSMFLSSKRASASDKVVGVIRLPRISNFTDFDALTLEEGVSVLYVSDPKELDYVDGLIIPGTKNTIQDLMWLERSQFASRIKELRGKVPILGVCGGYQMLGDLIRDVHGIEGGVCQQVHGLGLLQAVTNFDAYDKRTLQVSGELLVGAGGDVRGYEIHMGRTEVGEPRRLFRITSEGAPYEEGSISADDMVMGTYLHGAFDLSAFRRFFVELMVSRAGGSGQGDQRSLDEVVEESLALTAQVLLENLDLSPLIPGGHGGEG